jgi:hypothetical protein
MSAGRDKKARTKERKQQVGRALAKRADIKAAQKERRKAKRIARYETRLKDPLRRKRISAPYQ